MSIYRTSVTISFFLAIFLIQESIVNRIDFFIGGFSLYLALLFTWLATEEKGEAFISAFIAGIILDLTPSFDTPVGLWTATLLIFSYLVSTYRESLGDLDERPMTAALYLVVGTSLSILIYVILSGVLGNAIPPFFTVVREIAGNALWTLLFSPIYFPLVNRLKVRLFEVRSAP
jgi:rod shape-determining protein MreD